MSVLVGVNVCVCLSVDVLLFFIVLLNKEKKCLDLKFESCLFC